MEVQFIPPRFEVGSGNGYRLEIDYEKVSSGFVMNFGKSILVRRGTNVPLTNVAPFARSPTKDN
eukprot:2580606-Amphidinium_carterae.1